MSMTDSNSGVDSNLMSDHSPAHPDMTDCASVEANSPHTPLTFIFTLPNELLWEIVLLLGVKDLKNLRIASSFFRFLAVFIFRHMAVKITASFVEDVTWFISRGNQNLPVTAMTFHSSISRREQRDIVQNGLEILAQSDNLAKLNQLHFFGKSTELAPLLYGLQKLNVTTIRSIVIRYFVDQDKAIYSRKPDGLNSLLSKVENIDIQIFKSRNDRFLKWMLGPDNMSNLKILKLLTNSTCPFPRLGHRPAVDLTLGMNGRVSNSLQSLTIDNYVINISFFDLPLFRSATQLSEVILDSIHLMPRNPFSLVGNAYPDEAWYEDDWESVIDKLDKEYRDTGCVIRIRRPQAPRWYEDSRGWGWDEELNLPSKPPHIRVENQMAEG